MDIYKEPPICQLPRGGTQTQPSFQNGYRGPTEDVEFEYQKEREAGPIAGCRAGKTVLPG